MPPTIWLAQQQAAAESTENLQKIKEIAAEASQAGAQMLIFPEYMMSYPDKKGGRHEQQPLYGGFTAALCTLARETGLWLICGMTEKAGRPYALPYNTIVVINSAGGLIAAHRKTLLYDAFHWQESNDFSAGDTPFTPIETPWGRMGLACCYELRFPEVFTRQNCDFFVVPAAWVRGPNKAAHWQTLLAARAIENGVPVLGCTQTSPKVFTGGSAVYAPTGVCTAALGEEPGILKTELDLSANDPTTRRNSRPELYGPAAKPDPSEP